MSFSLAYVSYSLSRADKGWENFREDFLAAKKKKEMEDIYKNRPLTEQELEQAKEMAKEAKIKFLEKRKLLFEFLDESGYIIPWIDWNSKEGLNRYKNPVIMTDDDKLQDLLSVGYVIKKDVPLDQKNIQVFSVNKLTSLLEECSDLLCKYQSFERDPKSCFNEGGAILNDSQRKILEDSEFFYDLEDEDLIQELCVMDIFYGGVVVDDFENPNYQENLFGAIMSVYGIEEPNSQESKTFLIKIFENINDDFINKVIDYYCDCSDDEVALEEEREILKEYLRLIRPVVLDLKNTPDSIFFKTYNRDIEDEDFDKMFLERARRHLDEYKELLLGV